MPSQNLACVFHLGKHICTMKLETETRKKATKRKAHGTIPKTGSAKRVVVEQIENLIGEGRIDDVQNEAVNWVDTRMAKRVLSDNNNLDVVDEDKSFDAVAIIKKQADMKDEFYIYRLNNGSMNDFSDYVFKSSRIMAELAIQMDVEGPDNILQEENAYFDASHKRVHGFLSLGLWLFYPTM